MNPIQTITQHLETHHPGAHNLLTVGGYYDAQKWNLDEQTFKEEIDKLISGRPVTLEAFDVLDVATILEDDLYIRFEEKLQKAVNDLDLKTEYRNFALKSMMGVRK